MDMVWILNWLRKTSGKSNLNFRYIHKILTDWYNEGLKTKEAVISYLYRKDPAPRMKLLLRKCPKKVTSGRGNTVTIFMKIKKSVLNNISRYFNHLVLSKQRGL